MLKSFDKGVPVESISTVLPFDPHGPLPKNYKLNYGIRFCGVHDDTQRPMYYGFDLFFQVTGCGLDLEGFLTFCQQHNLLIDWYNFQRTSIERGNWLYKTLKKKVSYPIIDVFGEDYWREVNYRFMKYEWSLMNPTDKERFRYLFEK